VISTHGRSRDNCLVALLHETLSQRVSRPCQATIIQPRQAESHPYSLIDLSNPVATTTLIIITFCNMEGNHQHHFVSPYLFEPATPWQQQLCSGYGLWRQPFSRLLNQSSLGDTLGNPLVRQLGTKSIPTWQHFGSWNHRLWAEPGD